MNNTLLKIKDLKHQLFYCYDWNDVGNCDDIRAVHVATKILDLCSDLNKSELIEPATKLVELADDFCDLPAMKMPNDKVLLLLGHIVQEMQRI